MDDPLLTIEARPTTMLGRAHQWIRGRRIMLSAILALLEVVAFLIWRPSTLLLATLAVVVLVACVAIATRIGAGIPRDLLWIVAIAQGIVVAVPLILGLTLVAGMLVAVVLIVGLVAVAARWRV